MKPVTVAVRSEEGEAFRAMVRLLDESPLVEDVLLVDEGMASDDIPESGRRPAPFMGAKEVMELVLERVRTPYLLLIPGGSSVALGAEALARMIGAAESTGAGMVYPDFFDEEAGGKSLHPLNDYQEGSVRDDFDFGGLFLLSVAAVENALGKYGATPPVRYAGLYDLRLKVSIDHRLVHLKEPLYTVAVPGQGAAGGSLFAYVDPRNEAIQKEMEAVFTDHLRRVGAYLPPDSFLEPEEEAGHFPAEASVIIPVLNRTRTVPDAVQSALSQETDFPFNVIVVDNHSTDGTTTLLSALASRHTRLVHVVPSRTDLAIGGCWNEALNSPACGRFSVQLDSDDLYESPRTLQRMIDALRSGNHAMVVGSYTLVDENLRRIPPGLVDHREWTDANGRNNALRVNGLGAPRGFRTALMRRIGFPNVSYGEDYAAALRICRAYRIGRIFESLYLCRRWSGNTDAALSVEAANRNDAFKDSIRSAEIEARREMNRMR